MSTSIGMTTENAFATSASVRQRVEAIGVKLRELERLALQIPADTSGLRAVFAQELQRCQRFSWQLLKDLEAATTPRVDAQT